MRFIEKTLSDRQVIWFSFMTCTFAAPSLAVASLLMGQSPLSALTTYLAFCLIPTVVVIITLTANLLREQTDPQSSAPVRLRPIACGSFAGGGHAK